MAEHEEKMAAARAAALFKAPYFSSVIYGFVFHPIEGIRTMLVTAKMVLGYDPAWAVEATVDELAADIVHEVHHFMRKHFERAVNIQDPELFNLAGDLAINPDMRAGGWKLATGPKGAVYPAMYDLPEGKSTEEYYELLKQQKAEGGGSGKKKLPGDPSDDGEGAGSGKEKGGICRGHCGGIGGSSDHETQLNAAPDLGRDVAEMKGIEMRAINDIKQHAERHGRGSVPASMLEWIAKFDDTPHVRWQDELASILRDTTGRLQAGGDDFSMRRPSKRSFLRGILRPGMVEHLPEVAVIRDSSGSMGAKQLRDAAREAYGIMQALGIDEVWFADADTEISVPWRRVGGQFFRELSERHGGGGTDFRQPIESALKLSPRPDLLVYVTDGDGTTTKMPPPNVVVVWCIVPSYYNKAPAAWGHVVIVSDDPKVRKAKVQRPTITGEDDDDDAST